MMLLFLLILMLFRLFVFFASPLVFKFVKFFLISDLLLLWWNAQLDCGISSATSHSKSTTFPHVYVIGVYLLHLIVRDLLTLKFEAWVCKFGRHSRGWLQLFSFTLGQPLQIAIRICHLIPILQHTTNPTTRPISVHHFNIHGLLGRQSTAVWSIFIGFFLGIIDWYRLPWIVSSPVHDVDHCERVQSYVDRVA